MAEVVRYEGQLDMTGINLARHYVQQAQENAEFLQGGAERSELLEALILTPEQAADAVRDDLRQALAALEQLA